MKKKNIEKNKKLKYDLTTLKLNEVYTVIEKEKDKRKQEFKIHNLKLVDLNTNYLIFESEKGLKTCFLNNKGLIKIKEL